MVRVLSDLNETRNCDEVFELMVDLAKEAGFKAVMYEYCDDINKDDAKLFMRTSLPSAFERLEKLVKKPDRLMQGRIHARDHLTLGVAGIEFADMYEDFPEYVNKMRIAAIMPGIRSGFGVPLRSHNPHSRAAFVFASKLRRPEFLDALENYGWSLTAASYAAHTRILQLQTGFDGVKIEFTERQQTYLRHLAEGLLDKQIAHEMGISHSGVRKFQVAIAKKMGVSSRSQILTSALRQGLVSDPAISDDLRPNGGIWDMLVADKQSTKG